MAWGERLYLPHTSLHTDAQPLVCFCIRLLFNPVFCIFHKEIDLIKNAIKFINWPKLAFKSRRKKHEKDAIVSLTVSTELLSRKYEIGLRAMKSLRAWLAKKNFTMWITSSPLTVCKAEGLNKSIVLEKP